MSDPRTAGRVAWGLAAGSLALVPVAIALGLWSGPGLDGLHQSNGALVFCLAFPVLGALVVQRRGSHAVGWLMLAIGGSLTIHWVALQWSHLAVVDRPGALPLGVLASWVATWAWFPGWGLALTLLLVLLPDGRPAGRRRRLAWVDGLAIAGSTLAFAIASWPLRGPLLIGDAGRHDPREATLEAISGPVLALTALLGLASLVSLLVRFRRAEPDERRQIAWVVYGAGLAMVAGILGTFLDVGGLFDALASTALVGGLFMAVTRRHLYDIDLVVNRTLVYGALTATLAGAYLASVLVLQLALGALTQDSGPAVAASTLAVAALFRPARARIQGWVDRRFYRRRYDAQRTLVAFAARLRDEVDLGTVDADLTAVVRETLAPAHVSLWLREVPGR